MEKHQDPFLEFEEQLGNFLSGNSIDCVIFGYKHQQLKILLVQWKYQDIWSLPGGFIHREEGMDEAARRILKDRTGLDSIFLEQFYTFGSLERSVLHSEMQLERMNHLRESKMLTPKAFEWLKNRFITTGYFALADIERTYPTADFLSKKCEWKPIDEIPKLLLDHNEIVEKALSHLRIQLNYLPLGRSLLPDRFTMQDLQKLYESILQRPLERSNFQRKILKLDFLNRHNKHMTGAANKAPYLYSFNKKKYADLLKKGIGFL